MHVLLLISLAAAAAVTGCLAQPPEPCRCPDLLTGSLSVISQSERLWIFAKYIYDAQGQRIRIQELVSMDNKTYTYDMLLLYREAIAYIIYPEQRKCIKEPLKDSFHPMEIPMNATAAGQFTLGSSSEPGQGLLVNSWIGEIANAAKYVATVTAKGCVPVSTLYKDPQMGWILTSFFDNIEDIVDPGKLIPPDYCLQAKFEIGQKPRDFYSLFL